MAIFNSFTFDGINSLDYGVYINGEAVYNAPERVVNMVEVPGRNGAIAIDDGRFQNIAGKFPAGCFAKDKTEFSAKIATFRNILASRYNYVRITDTYNLDEFRMGLYRSGLEVDSVRYNSAGEFDIEFECKPQRWLLSGEESQTFTATGTINNPTMFGARPLLAVTGGGILTVGTRTMTIIDRSDPNAVIYIDCESQESWGEIPGGRESQNDYVQNAGEEFPVLNGGQNDIIVGSGITKVEITPRWWRI